jgi:LPXTG-site transpeptidase (sortase) family protein
MSNKIFRMNQLIRLIVSFSLISVVIFGAYITAYSKTSSPKQSVRLEPINSKLNLGNLESIPIPEIVNPAVNFAPENLKIRQIEPAIIQPPSPTQNQTSPTPKPIVNPQSRVGGAKVSIPAINLTDVSLDYGTVNDMALLQRKLLFNPVVENQLTQDFCGQGGDNSYLMGHSEPSIPSEDSYPAARVFRNLHKLKLGDVIQTTNLQNEACSYQITKIFRVTTDQTGYVPGDIYNDLFWPAADGASILTIQTCELGSATVRLIIRAKRIS